MTTLDRTRRRRSRSRARYPDEEGYVERDGVRIFYEVYGDGRADGAPAADVVDHPLAALEDADPVPRAPLPRASRSTAAATAARTGPRAPRRTTSASSRSTRSRCWTRPATERAVARRRLVRRAAGALLLAAEHPERVAGAVFIGPARRARRRRCPSARCTPSTSRSTPTRAGRSTTATTGCATTATSSSSSSGSASPSRTRRSRSRTASAGRSRRRPRRSSRPRRGTGLPTGVEFARALRAASAARCSSSTATTTRSARTRRAQRSPRRPAASSSRSRASGHIPHARDPVKVNLLLRDFVAPPAARATLGARQVAPQARALHLLADRPRPRPARRRDRRASCASSIPTSRSTGSPSTR